MIANKENCNSRNKLDLQEAAQGKVVGKRLGGFDRLLKEVTNQIREDGDQKLANYTLEHEAAQIASTWFREEQDHKAAERLYRELKEEEKEEKSREIHQGEKEALHVAMEERRQLREAAEAKREMEDKDTEYAKKVILDEVEESYRLKELCEYDNIKAKEVYDALQDELLAEDIYRQEKEIADKMKQRLLEIEEADRKMASEQQNLINGEMKRALKKQNDEDFEIARQAQIEMRVTELQAKLRQEQSDSMLSQKLTVKSMRAEHRRRKRVAYLSSLDCHVLTEKAIADQWVNADADVEDVANGICITLVLPHMRNLKVKTCGKMKVEIDATRMVFQGDSTHTAENSCYSAEFLIEGPSVKLQESDLSYEYESETGMLHVYIESVHLDEKIGQPVCNSKSFTVIDKVKNGFSRIFTKTK